MPGVLVAISIPIFTSQLEKAREATDLANIRATYAELAADVLEADGKGANKDVPQKMQSEGKFDKIGGDKVVAGYDLSNATVEKGSTANVAIGDDGSVTITFKK